MLYRKERKTGSYRERWGEGEKRLERKMEEKMRKGWSEKRKGRGTPQRQQPSIFP